ncbi:podocan-like protein 1 [Brienomyrus brachyistius]|uniref:podocan-like protein 1 n=1 Tax=Brienomyrus brachyistius TaxID=42636 RepID=UPI0020B1B47F|nr:podocan-like protein 1 [Brienomyrus brachyistius]XP_048867309.1 podocan-like protein 1 [Brienomyrus brachyistius]XP_048867310.1 podocan-like protein 1 [Brienomyrus brachyistius]XP_048867311.1 podocan-like protein 1 [Brienomyrus brachyistius]XP_048867312.1 podocan-like protein 1 [Brienomyrus brachyistius]
MEAFVLMLWTFAVPLQGYVRQPSLSVSVMTQKQQDPWFSFSAVKESHPVTGDWDSFAEEETKQGEWFMGESLGYKATSVDGGVMEDHLEDAGPGLGEEASRVGTGVEVSNRHEGGIQSLDGEALEPRQFVLGDTDLIPVVTKAVTGTVDNTHSVFVGNQTASQNGDTAHSLLVGKQTVNQTVGTTHTPLVYQSVSQAVIVKGNESGPVRTQSTASKLTWTRTVTDRPLSGGQKGAVTMATNKKVNPLATVPIEFTSKSLVQGSRPPKKESVTTKESHGKEGKQKKVEEKEKKKPAKKDDKKQKKEAYFPYFKDDYCPTECACYGRVVQCSDKGVDTVPYGIPFNVRYMLLMNNRIESVPLDLLKEYLALEFLVLSNNQLTDGSVEGAFEGMARLKRLFLDRNRLASVPSDLPTSLEELRLDGNDVSVMSEAAWSRCPDLQILSLANNSLGVGSVPPGVFAPLANLRILSLNHNHLPTVPLRLPSRLRELYLHGNRIEQVAGGAFSAGSALLSLDLSSNRLVDKSLQKDSFQHALSLESLNLEGNLLSQLPRHLPKALRTLNLEGNAITSISKGAFVRLPYLENLGLSRNRIVQVAPRAFGSLANLHQLDLSHNRLQQVPRNIPPTLHSVSLSHNRIRSVPRDAFCSGGRTAAPSMLVRVQLEHNPINMGELDSRAFWCLRGFQVVHFY